MNSHVQKHVPYKEIWDSREWPEHSSFWFFGHFTTQHEILMKKQHAGYVAYICSTWIVHVYHETGLKAGIERNE